MVKYWALQDAKSRLSELVKKVQELGPQYITVHGNHVVVVISQKEYEELIMPAISVVDFFKRYPLVGLNLKITRDKSLDREVDL